jgi:arylsulfatase A-like enzyme
MTDLTRRRFMAGLVAAAAPLPSLGSPGRRPPPNVILCMSDDQGWGDVGYNGHPVLRTPNLDAMAEEGIRFDRFYAAGPWCAPTRGSCLTGRNACRYGFDSGNEGQLPLEELTLAEVLRELGYVTGHFGKWHLGSLSRNRDGSSHHQKYSPPWLHGFDVCFTTQANVPTWDPLQDPLTGEAIETRYWLGPDRFVASGLQGDDSRIIMDRALAFVQEASQRSHPFFAVIWFHAPHSPVVAGAQYRALYPDQGPDEQHYYGALTAMDEQIGRLRRALQDLGVAANTMLWFCSDNGPARGQGDLPEELNSRARGSSGGLRSKKAALHEGGIRVPGLLLWPAGAPGPRRIGAPCVTSDYYPTILAALGHKPEGQPRPLDGINILGMLRATSASRPRPIYFRSGDQLAVVTNRYKLFSGDQGKRFELYDLDQDAAEENDLATRYPRKVERQVVGLDHWMQSVAASNRGADYRRSRHRVHAQGDTERGPAVPAAGPAR